MNEFIFNINTLTLLCTHIIHTHKNGIIATKENENINY